MSHPAARCSALDVIGIHSLSKSLALLFRFINLLVVKSIKHFLSVYCDSTTGILAGEETERRKIAGNVHGQLKFNSSTLSV